MSGKHKQEEDQENAILLEDLDEDSNPKENIQINADDEEMLLLSSSPSPPSSPPVNPKKKISTGVAGPSGISKLQERSSVMGSKTNMGGIVIEDSSDSSEEENSIEVIDSEDEEEDELDEESDSDESLSTFLDGKVQIFMTHGSFFIWDAEDVHMLREECRIVGKLVGCLPRAPRQNSQLGLPLQLMPEEAKLLEAIEAACVVEEVDAVHDDIGVLRKETFEAMRQDNFKIQQKMYKESRKEEVRQNKHKIIEGKKAKKRKIQELENVPSSNSSKKIKTVESSESDTKIDESLTDAQGGNNQNEEVGNVSDLQAAAGTKTENDQNQHSISDAVSSEISESKTEMETEPESGNTKDKGDLSNQKKVESPGDKMQGTSTETTEGEDKRDGQNDDVITMVDDDDDDFDVDELVTEETHVKHSLIQLFTENPWKESVKRPKQWIFPLSQKEFLRYEVFRDLWKKGYFLSSGSKFGGDFLVYPGDPARFHSHFIAVCIDKTVDLSALDIVSLGRLGSNVRKSVLLCALNKSRQVVYTTLQWTGIV